MDHIRQLENSKYRNWVRGGLAYKYLKEGIEKFADEVVRKEHDRILQQINHKPGVSCNQCNIERLLPNHKSEKNTGKKVCPRGQFKCNCLFADTKRFKACPNKVCDLILEDILKHHGFTPPMPNWKNTDMHKWVSDPWEIAKCFINAPGYSEKSAACEIDAAGLLHIFINNISLHSHLTHSAIKVFSETIKRRNSIIHSPTMELEDQEVDLCIDAIIAILEDDKELKGKHDAQLAVNKLKQLKQEGFIITTLHETEVCRAALAALGKRSKKLKEIIQNTMEAIKKTESDESDTIEDAAEKALDDVLNELTNDGQFQTLTETLDQLKSENAHMKIDIELFKKRLTELEQKIDTMRNIRQKQLEYAEGKQELQKQLVNLYQKHYVKTWACPLKVEQNDIDINEVYVTPNMRLEEKPKLLSRDDSNESFQDKQKECLINSYYELFHTDGNWCKRIVVVGDVGTGKSSFCKKMIKNWCRTVKDFNKAPTPQNEQSIQNEPNKKVKHENEIAKVNTIATTPAVPSKSTATDSSDVNMINDNIIEDTDDEVSETSSSSSEEEDDIMNEDKDIVQMKQFDFLFFIPLYMLQGENTDILEIIKAFIDDSSLDELIQSIFKNESERCLVLADGLDEWIPPQKSQPPHVSYGLLRGDRANKATIVILSRPSAKGILNMKTSEYDKKINILGIHMKSKKKFIANYMYKIDPRRSSEMTLNFCKILGRAKLRNLARTPLLLQHLIWMHCTNHEIGKSFSDIYSNIINVFFGWSENKNIRKEVSDDRFKVLEDYKDFQLPVRLKKLPRCESNKRTLLLLGKLAFEALTSKMSPNRFTRLALEETGVSKEDISDLMKIGILAENKSLDPNYDMTQLSFIHITYLEFFAAIFISSHFSSTGQNVPVLEKLFSRFKSAADILQMSNLLKIACGLSPFPVEELSRIISDVVTTDEAMVEYRNSLYHYEICMMKTLQIQRLLHNCLSECKRVCSECDIEFQPLISLCDVIIDSGKHISIVERIIPDSVLSLCIGYNFDLGLVPWMSQLDNLQYICIRYVTIPHEQHELMSQSLVLKHIALTDIRCDKKGCDVHINDLSGHSSLQNIYLEGSMHLLFPCGNPRVLQVINISFRQLEVRIQHKHYVRLLRTVEAAIRLKSLSLDNLSCVSKDCGGHNLDLWKHDQLLSLELEDCDRLSISRLNTTKLRELQIDNVNVKNMPYFANAKNLAELTVEGGHFERSFMESVVQTLHQLKVLWLSNTTCGSCALTVTTKMKHLIHIKLDKVKMSMLTWCSFVNSLLTLQQSVLVETWRFDVYQIKENTDRDFIRKDATVFEVTMEDAFFFHFRTLKFRGKFR